MNIDKRIKTFVILGKFLNQTCKNNLAEELSPINSKIYSDFKKVISEVKIYNPWFIERFVLTAIDTIAYNLTNNIEVWVNKYQKIFSNQNPKKIGVVMAGNIPLVGFHDMLCVLLSGNICIIKLSSKDDKLIKSIVNVIYEIEPEFKNLIKFTENHLRGFDAIIATGSNNTYRYFNFYFGNYQNIIRKNRNSISVLSGNETKNELIRLADDIFLYFGLGCRNVSKIFIPHGYDFNVFFNAIEQYRFIIDFSKYSNNYDYNRSIYLVNKAPHLDNGFVLLKEDTGISSPIGVIYYQYYDRINDIKNLIALNSDQLQCVVSGIQELEERTNFGESQYPELWDYADNIDTMKFLLSLK